MKVAKERGFTLVELMAVLGILAIIAIIAVPAIGTILKNAESSSDEATARMISDAAAIAHIDEKRSNTYGYYAVKDLVDNGYLDYDYERDGALDGKAVHLGSGSYAYANENLLTNTVGYERPWDSSGIRTKDHLGGNTGIKSNADLYGYMVAYADMSQFPPGEYMFSAWMKADTNINLSVGHRDGASTKRTTFRLTTDWQKYTWPVLTENVTTTGRVVYFYPRGTYVHMSHAKLERGSIATPWTPAEGE